MQSGCVLNTRRCGQTFLLDDGQVVSTPELICAVAQVMGRPACLLALLVSVLEQAGELPGKRRCRGAAYRFAVYGQFGDSVALRVDAAVYPGAGIVHPGCGFAAQPEGRPITSRS